MSTRKISRSKRLAYSSRRPARCSATSAAPCSVRVDQEGRWAYFSTRRRRECTTTLSSFIPNPAFRWVVTVGGGHLVEGDDNAGLCR